MAPAQTLTKIKIPYRPHAGQQLVHDSNARIRMVFCHIRWGKTLLVCQDKIRTGIQLLQERLPLVERGEFRFHLVPLVNMWNVAPSYKLLDQSIDEMKHFLPSELGWVLNKSTNDFYVLPYTTTDHRKEYHWKMSYRSGDDPEKMVAVGLDLLALEESRNIKRDAYQIAAGRLTDPGRLGRQLFSGTPGTEDDLNDSEKKHWQYAKYMQALSGDFPDMEAWKFSCYSEFKNPMLTDEKIKQAKQDMEMRTCKRDRLAECLPASGLMPMIPEYRPDLQFKPIRDRYSKDRTIYHNWDFGFGHPAVSICQFDAEGRWCKLGERMGDETRLEPFAEEALNWINTHWGDADVIVVNGDHAGNQRKDTGRTSIDVLESIYSAKGFNLHVNSVPNTEDELERGIDIIAKRCRIRDDGTPGFLLDTSCPISNKAYSGGWCHDERRTYKSGRPKPKKDGYYDHLADTDIIMAMNEMGLMGDAIKRDVIPEVSSYQSRDDFYGAEV